MLHPDIPEGKILLHACCAPCSGAIVECLVQNGARPTIFYSNSNIYPLKEYEIRRDECRRYAAQYGLELIDDEYDHEQWGCIAKGLEGEPERGGRCLHCFRFRLERAARYASENGFSVLTTTLASSRWKNLDQVNAAGEYACSLYPGVRWWPQNWRKGGLQERRGQIIKEQCFYNQLYCGCEFSLR
ncbi:MAG: epoxyqueuosine reductase QueH [Bacteroidales bacterium]|nr:epoxyqueuosine reductase QueH [Bacteroidales bacterium]